MFGAKRALGASFGYSFTVKEKIEGFHNDFSSHFSCFVVAGVISIQTAIVPCLELEGQQIIIIGYQQYCHYYSTTRGPNYCASLIGVLVFEQRQLHSDHFFDLACQYFVVAESAKFKTGHVIRVD